MTYAEWLRAARKRNNYTQGQLGELAGLGRTYINTLENGGVQLPTKETRDKIHGVLGTSDEELIDRGVYVVNAFGEDVVPDDEEPEPVRTEVVVRGAVDEAVRQAFFADLMERARRVRWDEERILYVLGLLDNMLTLDRRRE